jgi:hypothetical protein
MEGDTSVLIVPEFMHLDISENKINHYKCRETHEYEYYLVTGNMQVQK